jgi:hypothetical protein
VQVRPLDVLPLVALAPAAAIAVFWLGSARPWSVWTIAWMSALSAGVLGVPVVAWCLERGYRRVPAIALVSAVAGAVPPFVATAAGTAGLLWRFGWSSTWSALQFGAPLPLLGVILWRRFLYVVLLAMIAAAVAGAAQAVVRRLLGAGTRPAAHR